MQHRAVWLSFIEECGRAASQEDVGVAFLREMGRLGFAHVALCSHVDPLNIPDDAVAILDIPQVWLDHFSAEKYQRIDPLYVESSRRLTPFFWDEPDVVRRRSTLQKRVLDEASEVELESGITIPIHHPAALPASCTLVPGDGGADPANYVLAQFLAIHAHERAWQILNKPEASARLSRRERECLTLAARGKSDWTISEILGISERTAHHAMERAKARLGVATRVQAIVRAISLGEISTHEVDR